MAAPVVAVVVPGTVAVLEVDPEVVPGTVAVHASAEGGHILVVAEEAPRPQTEDVRVGPGLSRAWGLRVCPHQAWAAPCEAGGNPGGSRRDDQNQLVAWRGYWGRDSPAASGPWPSYSAPPPASGAQNSQTPPH